MLIGRPSLLETTSIAAGKQPLPIASTWRAQSVVDCLPIINVTSHTLSSTDKARTQAPVGTATVLEYLHRTEPSTDFHFCLGADAYADLMAGRWRQSQRVWELLEDRLWVVGRPGVKVDAKDGGAHGVEVELADVSSSQARACQSVQELDGLVVRAVRDYIVEHRLYGFGDDQP